MTPEEAEEFITKAVDLLGDHFEAVQVMVSWNEQGETRCLKRGGGNWYARQGMAHEFINEDAAQETAYQISKKLKGEEDED